MKKEDLLPLNSEFSEFELQRLEERLETDPLAVSGLVDISTEDPVEGCEFKCGHLTSCVLSIVE